MDICIDPGHGGSDPGAVNDEWELQEKDIVLDIGERLAVKLEEKGHHPVLTRGDDRFVSIRDRAAIANNHETDIFVSIHTNSFTDPDAYGIETLFWPSSTLGHKLADYTQRELVKLFEWANRGIKGRDDLGVLRHTAMPAILPEIGFISNPDEVEVMQRADFRRRAAEALLRGIESFQEGGE